MDLSSVKAISAIPSPVLRSHGKLRTLAINCFGLVVVLDKDGRLWYCNTRNSEELGKLSEIPVVGGSDQLLSQKFTSLTFSENGYQILLWSKSSLGTIEIPRSWSDMKQKYNCKYYSCVDVSENQIIIHAEFHSHSSAHLVYLQPNQLVTYDLVTLSSERIPLGIDHSFVSFCFGPRIDWLALSVILLEQDGTLYILCPVIPQRIRLEAAIVQGLHNWVLEQQRYNTSGGDSQYIQSIQHFLDSIECDSSSYPWPQDDFINDSPGIPVLQGPLKFIRCVKGRDNNRVRRATDIAVPMAQAADSESASPVIAVAFDDGVLELLIICVENDASQGLFAVSPLWAQTHLQARRLRTIAPATALKVEEICIEENGSGSNYWSVAPDKVHNHILHVSCKEQLSSYLVSVDWIKKVANSSSAEDANSSNGGYPHSSTIPVFCPTRTGLPNTSCLSAAVVALDPLLGHIALFRVSEGPVACVNLTVHSRLCDLQMKLKTRSVEEESKKSMEDSIAGQMSASFNKTIESLIQSALVGLGTIPTFEETVLESIISADAIVEETKTEADNRARDAIVAVTEHLKRTVVTPMYELHERLKYKTEMTQSAIAAQSELLNGSGKDTPSLSNTIEEYRENVNSLNDRVTELLERFASQKARSEKLLAALTYMRSKISTAERQHYQQLKVWAQDAAQMESVVESLAGKVKHFQQRLQAPPAPVESSASTGLDSSAEIKSPYKSPYKTPSLTPSPGINARRLTPVNKPLLASRLTSNSVGKPIGNTTPLGSSRTAGLMYKGGSVFGTPQTPAHVANSNSDSAMSTPLSKGRYSDRKEPVNLPTTPVSRIQSLSEAEIESIAKAQHDQTNSLEAYVDILKKLENRLVELNSKIKS